MYCLIIHKCKYNNEYIYVNIYCIGQKRKKENFRV